MSWVVWVSVSSQTPNLDGLRDLKFGVALPGFASPGAGLFRTPGFVTPDAAFCLELARCADAAGFSSIFSADHLMIGKDDAVLEGWTLLSAVASITRSAQLGLIQQNNLFRNPAVSAKSVATLDRISSGRALMFCNFGADRAETSAYGLQMPDEVVRVSMFAEAVDLMKRLWSATGPVSFVGDHYRLDGAVLAPGPLHAIPLWLTGTHAEALSLLSRHATGWCTAPISPEEYGRRSNIVRSALTSAGRGTEGFEFALETQVLIAETLDELRMKLRRLIALDPTGAVSGRSPMDPVGIADFLDARTDDIPASLTEKWLVGTPDLIRQQIRSYFDASAHHVILWFMDLPDMSGFNLFRKEVLP